MIDNNVNVSITAPSACKSLDIKLGSSLNITTLGTLLASNNGINYPAITISGSLLINGELIVDNPQNSAIEIYGKLTNNSKIKSTYSSLESIIIKSGGRFDDFGKTILK